jgi:hypothetical protein
VLPVSVVAMDWKSFSHERQPTRFALLSFAGGFLVTHHDRIATATCGSLGVEVLLRIAGGLLGQAPDRSAMKCMDRSV